MMDLFDRAICYATKAHAGMKRKGTETPYIVHPMESAAVVATMTNEPAVLAAAVLHDVVEDTKRTLEEVRAEFGGVVAGLVASESEDKREDLPSDVTWKVRKQETLEHLKHASREAKIIALGDKLSNIRAIYRDYMVFGDKVWERFNQKDPREQAWYYRGIADCLSELAGTFAYAEYVELVGKVFMES